MLTKLESLASLRQWKIFKVTCHIISPTTYIINRQDDIQVLAIRVEPLIRKCLV